MPLRSILASGALSRAAYLWGPLVQPLERYDLLQSYYPGETARVYERLYDLMSSAASAARTLSDPSSGSLQASVVPIDPTVPRGSTRYSVTVPYREPGADESSTQYRTVVIESPYGLTPGEIGSAAAAQEAARRSRTIEGGDAVGRSPVSATQLVADEITINTIVRGVL